MAEETKVKEAVEAEAKTPQPAQAQQEQQQAPQGPDLNISDLAALKNIIEVATQRGAFKANELAAVGTTFNKLEAFLNEVAKQKEDPQGGTNG